jgi:hypothetical protein
MSDFRLKNEYNIHTLKVSAMEDIEGKGMRSLVNYPVVQGVYAMGQVAFNRAQGISSVGQVAFNRAQGVSSVGQVVFNRAQGVSCIGQVVFFRNLVEA